MDQQQPWQKNLLLSMVVLLIWIVFWGFPWALAQTGATASTAASPVELLVPPEMGLDNLEARRSAQLASASSFQVFHGFRWVDRLAPSGITFKNQIVDDAGLRYKAVHYDHGNGLAAADVDGDGRVDLYFVTFLGQCELWRNLGAGRFENITARAGVAMENRVSVSASFADIDNDGDPDLFVTSVRKGNALFENDGTGRFREITAEAGLTYVGHSSSGVFFDYDNDGLLDLFLANVGQYTLEEQGRGGYYVGRDNAFSLHLDPTRSEASILYRNLGGRKFQDVSAAALLVDRSWSGDATAVDFNSDGYLDLYVLNMQGADHYYENVQGKFFVDKTARLFPKTPIGAMGVKAFDWNNDGQTDLLITDMHSDMYETDNIGPAREKEKTPLEIAAKAVKETDPFIFGNALWERRGDRFVEVSDQVGAENYWPWGVSVDDVNADGWDDAFITSSMNYPFRYAINSLLLNDRGQRFRDSEFILGIEPRAGRLILPWFELDCAGDPGATAGDPLKRWENFGADMHGHETSPGQAAAGPKAASPAQHPHCTGLSGKVVVMSAKGTRSSVIFDLDGDGDLDIVTNEFNDSPQVLISDLAAVRQVHYLELELVGTRSNRGGVGTRVTVFSGGRFQVKVQDGKSGYLSQSVLPLYFGLGDSTQVERIEVAWPSGQKQVVQPAAINTRIKIVEN